jgi:hypothetical protein
MISRHTSKHSPQRQPQDDEGEPVFGERHVAQTNIFDTLGSLFHELDECILETWRTLDYKLKWTTSSSLA